MEAPYLRITPGHYTNIGEKDTLFKDREPPKTIPYSAARTYIAHIGENPPGAFTNCPLNWCCYAISGLLDLSLDSLSPFTKALTLTGGQKIALVYKQNFTGRLTLQRRAT